MTNPIIYVSAMSAILLAPNDTFYLYLGIWAIYLPEILTAPIFLFQPEIRQKMSFHVNPLYSPDLSCII
ncbi:hypothetical protein D5282_02860 [bacterium 1xD8-48]|nr:hypothetical protein [bacterium 1xD8-48]